MSRTLRSGLGLVVAMAILAPEGAQASAISDFQARMLLTTLCMQQAEAVLRSMPASSVTLPTPEGVASWMTLVTENVAALARTAATASATADQRKAMTDGLRTMAAAMHDEVAMLHQRGFEGAAVEVGAQEQACRAAIEQVSAASVPAPTPTS